MVTDYKTIRLWARSWLEILTQDHTDFIQEQLLDDWRFTGCTQQPERPSEAFIQFEKISNPTQELIRSIEQ